MNKPTKVFLYLASVLILTLAFLPRFKEIAERQQRENCLSNLSKISSANLLYTQDCDGRMPPVATRTVRSSGGKWYQGDAKRWADLLSSYNKNLDFTCSGQERKGLADGDSTEERSRVTSYQFVPQLSPSKFGSKEGNFVLNISEVTATMIWLADASYSEVNSTVTKHGEISHGVTIGGQAVSMKIEQGQ